jgi:hypothetical protein
MTLGKDWPIIVIALAGLVIAFNCGRYMEQTARTVKLRSACDVERLDALKAGFYSPL